MRRSLLLLLALPLAACAGQDRDGDGYNAADDCDDDNDNVNPGAGELCDGVDNDCDGETDEGVAATWYADSDEDGYGNPEIVLEACDQPEGFVDNDADCNDNDDAFKPGAPEFCEDPNDYNCDGSVGFEDADGDGVAACEDCDDTNAAISPEAVEICDGIDNDCDNDIDVDTDPTDANTFWFDGDQDGYGTPDYSINACDPPFGYTDNNEDCDDSSELAFPGGDEVCDGLDNDCDGTVDGASASDAFEVFTDEDGDGFGQNGTGALACEVASGFADADGDCDDSDVLVNPGEVEVCNDGIDNDCDGVTTGCEAPASSASLALAGEAAEDFAGISMVGTLDLNNDGNTDLVVGASQIDVNDSNDGGAYVLYGPLTAGSENLSVADARLVGPNSASRAGINLIDAGDLNGDGMDDLVVSAERANSNGAAAGSAYLLLGGSSTWSGDYDLATIADHEWTGTRAYNWMAAGLASGGDINGDGYDDLIAGCNGDDTASADAGRVWLLLGGPVSSLPSVVSGGDASWTGERTADFAGGMLAGPGDMDGDGLGEIVVGMNRGDALGAFTGVVYIISGDEASGDASLGDVTALINGDSAGDRLGQDVSAAGDIDGDGLNDLLAGANRVDTTGADAGAAFIIPGVSDLSSHDGAAVSGIATHSFYGDQPSDGLGAEVNASGDFDGDGTNDVLLGVNFAGFNEEGTAYLFLSPAAGTYNAGSDEDAAIIGDGSGDGLGRTVGFGGDILGASHNTVLVGSWQDDANGTDSGGAYVFSSLGL